MGKPNKALHKKLGKLYIRSARARLRDAVYRLDEADAHLGSNSYKEADAALRDALWSAKRGLELIEEESEYEEISLLVKRGSIRTR